MTKHSAIPLDASDVEAYDNGLECSWCGKSVMDMSMDELIAFVGMLDIALAEARACVVPH